MARPRAPLWLATPSRFARFSKTQARWLLAAFALLLLASATAMISKGPPVASHDPASADADRADVILY